MRRLVGGLVAALLVAGAALGLTPAHATSWTSASYASRLVQLVDQARQQHGLGTLTVASGTSEVAASWTAHLDATRSLAHNPDLRHQLETHGSPDWTTYGENVGQGPANDPDALFDAYMNSAEHRGNILNGAYRFTGVAVVLDGDTAWNTFDFVDTYHSPRVAITPTRTAAPAVAVTVPSTADRAERGTVRARARAATVKATSRTLPHTGARPAADRLPDLAQLLGGSSAGGVRSPIVVLAASVHPMPPGLPPSSELVIAVAGLLLGFVGVRWWQVARAA